MFVHFSDAEQFFQETEAAELAPQIVPQIWETLFDQENRINLKLQLAWTADVGHHFVTATYYLEGDGFSHAMRNSKLLLKDVVCPTSQMFALFFGYCNRRSNTECRYTGTEGKSMR